jgi:CMP-N,N'-diacetyllegionaminic acid synthase
MIGTKNVLAIIVARGGSKGLPGKNIAPCGGRPMIDWTILAARGSRYIDRTIVSTDDPAIIAAARAAGAEVPFVRPADLATDEVALQVVVEHAIATVGAGYNLGVLLQVTSPLRIAEDIDGALELMERTGAPSVVGVVEAVKSPYLMFSIGGDERIQPLFPDQSKVSRRQALPKAYSPNGAVYVFDFTWFLAKRLFFGHESAALVMPSERSVDVDTRLDLALADILLQQRSKTGVTR